MKCFNKDCRMSNDAHKLVLAWFIRSIVSLFITFYSFAVDFSTFALSLNRKHLLKLHKFTLMEHIFSWIFISGNYCTCQPPRRIVGHSHGTNIVSWRHYYVLALFQKNNRGALCDCPKKSSEAWHFWRSNQSLALWKWNDRVIALSP